MNKEKEKKLLTLKNTIKMYLNTLNEAVERDNFDSCNLILEEFVKIKNDFDNIYLGKELKSETKDYLLTSRWKIYISIDGKNINEKWDIVGFYFDDDNHLVINVLDEVNSLPILDFENIKNKEVDSIIIEYSNGAGECIYTKHLTGIRFINYKQLTPDTIQMNNQTRVYSISFSSDNLYVYKGSCHNQ